MIVGLLYGVFWGCGSINVHTEHFEKRRDYEASLSMNLDKEDLNMKTSESTSAQDMLIK